MTPAYPTSITLLFRPFSPHRSAMSRISTVTSSQVGIHPGSPGRRATDSSPCPGVAGARLRRARVTVIHTMRASR